MNNRFLLAPFSRCKGDAGSGFTKRSALQGNVMEGHPIKMAGSYGATFTNTAQNWLAQMVFR